MASTDAEELAFYMNQRKNEAIYFTKSPNRRVYVPQNIKIKLNLPKEGLDNRWAAYLKIKTYQKFTELQYKREKEKRINDTLKIGAENLCLTQ